MLAEIVKSAHETLEPRKVAEWLAGRLQEDFQRDLAQSHRVTYRKWYRRPLVERAWELVGWLLERQQ